MKFSFITCYPNHANLVSVISQNEDYLPWFLNNYIQLFADKNDYKKGFLRLDFYTNNLYSFCPFIDHQKISRTLIQNAYNSVIEFLLDALKENCYIYLIIDRYEISNYKSDYLKNHSVHDIFIYGVDSDEGKFLVADNFSNGIYSYEETPFNQIEKAYEMINRNDSDDWLGGVHLIKYKENRAYFGMETKYIFDLEKLLIELDDYLNSYKTAKRYANPHDQWMIYTSDMGFGLEVYDIIITYLKEVEKPTDKRPLFVLSEHKKIMLMRIIFLQQKYKISCEPANQYSGIVEESKIINSLYIKLLITGEGAITNRIINKLIALKNKEREVLEFLYRLLCKLK